MVQYTNEQLEQNYNKFLDGIKASFTGKRLELLLHMYSMDELGPNLLLAPASGNIKFHNTYEGGYIDHVINVCRNSIRMMKLYTEAGGTVDFTTDEILFAAFHHDLGKLGEPGIPYYVRNPSEWHVKNQGKLFISSPDLMYLGVTDRTFFTLQKYGISYNEQEYMGIRLADGMYEETNKSLLMPWSPDMNLKYRLPHILHWADHMSTKIEQDIQKASE